MVTVSGNSNPTNPTYPTNPTNPTNPTTINSGELTDKNPPVTSMRTLSEKTDASSAVDGVEAQFSNSNN